MKQLLILSGKGGTGKTTIASAFIQLSKAKAYADCDVDAPNLHLISNLNTKPITNDFYGLPKAKINSTLCVKCNQCFLNCQFNAISKGTIYQVNAFACEGCGVCKLVCPTNAISLQPAIAGDLRLYNNNNTFFSTAQLKMGNGTSGKLVTEVKKQLRANTKNAELAIIDGSPGIGCPVIASLSGVDMVLIVAEPSISGINDMKRIIKTSTIFNNKICVCINKYDTNLNNTNQIESFCEKHQISFVGKIPYDSEAIKAINNGNTIVDVDCPSGIVVKDIYDKTIKLLLQN